MTMGHLIFYSGFGLLILTALTAIIFCIKKPQYIPENVIYEGKKDGNTQKFQSGYPTERVTKRWKQRTLALNTQKLKTENSTEKLSQTERQDQPKEDSVGTLKLNAEEIPPAISGKDS